MLKKLLTFSIILCIGLTICSFCYATDDGLNKVGSDIKNTVTDSGDAIRSGVGNIENGIEDAAKNTGDAIKSGTQNVGNAISDVTNHDNERTSNDYTAVRTATSGTSMGMSSNTWTWLIIAIATMAIVALVWYYGTQNENSKIDNHD